MAEHLYRDFTPSWRRKPRVHPVVWLTLAATLGVGGWIVSIAALTMLGMELAR